MRRRRRARCQVLTAGGRRASRTRPSASGTRRRLPSRARPCACRQVASSKNCSRQVNTRRRTPRRRARRTPPAGELSRQSRAALRSSRFPTSHSSREPEPEPPPPPPTHLLSLRLLGRAPLDRTPWRRLAHFLKHPFAARSRRAARVGHAARQRRPVVADYGCDGAEPRWGGVLHRNFRWPRRPLSGTPPAPSRRSRRRQPDAHPEAPACLDRSPNQRRAFSRRTARAFPPTCLRNARLTHLKRLQSGTLRRRQAPVCAPSRLREVKCRIPTDRGANAALRRLSARLGETPRRGAASAARGLVSRTRARARGRGRDRRARPQSELRSAYSVDAPPLGAVLALALPSSSACFPLTSRHADGGARQHGPQDAQRGGERQPGRTRGATRSDALAARNRRVGRSTSTASRTPQSALVVCGQGATATTLVHALCAAAARRNNDLPTPSVHPVGLGHPRGGCQTNVTPAGDAAAARGRCARGGCPHISTRRRPSARAARRGPPWRRPACAVSGRRADAAVRHVSIVAGRSYSDAEQKPSVVVTQLPATARHSSRVSGLVSASSSAAVTIRSCTPPPLPLGARRREQLDDASERHQRRRHRARLGAPRALAAGGVRAGGFGGGRGRRRRHRWRRRPARSRIWSCEERASPSALVPLSCSTSAVWPCWPPPPPLRFDAPAGGSVFRAARAAPTAVSYSSIENMRSWVRPSGQQPAPIGHAVPSLPNCTSGSAGRRGRRSKPSGPKPPPPAGASASRSTVSSPSRYATDKGGTTRRRVAPPRGGGSMPPPAARGRRRGTSRRRRWRGSCRRRSARMRRGSR